MQMFTESDLSSSLSSPINVILAIDIGSSSIRCSAHQRSNVDASKTTLMDHCSMSREFQAIDPITGRIKMQDSFHGKYLLDEIDSLIDECLAALRKHVMNPFQIIGLGFSSFVMNFVAVDENGTLVGEMASLSYACQSPEVAQACQKLRRYVQ